MQLLKKLFPFLKKHWKKYIPGVFFLILVDLMQVFIPDIIKLLTDEYQAGILTYNRILFFTGAIILAWAIIVIGRFCWRYFLLSASRQLEYELRSLFFRKLLSHSPNYFTKNKTGHLMALATNDINAIRLATGFGFVAFIDATFMLVVVVIKMFVNTGFVLTGLVFAILPAIFLYTIYFGKLIHKAFKKTQESFSKLTDVTQESFSGISVVKGFAQEDLFGLKFGKVNKDAYFYNMKLAKIRAGFQPTMTFISSISFLLVLLFGGNAVINGTISLGNFIAFNMYLQMVLWPIQAFGWVINQMQRGTASMERLNTVLESIPEIEDPVLDSKLENSINEIEFQSVSFCYPDTDRQVIQDISFKISKNKSLAIIGNTGSGKSTIINLLLRLYDLQNEASGKILIDGVDIKSVSLKNLRESVGFAPQDNFLFSGTINENIAFSCDDYQGAFDEVKKVASIADLEKNILDFPEGYDTIIGERGVSLSGGQKQRASIARAIIKKPSFLILDDSFSAVDTETEDRILTNLKEYNKDCGVIIISHRISSIKNCDEILVLQDGQIIERGNDADLMEKKGLYYKMAMIQRLDKNDDKEK